MYFGTTYIRKLFQIPIYKYLFPYSKQLLLQFKAADYSVKRGSHWNIQSEYWLSSQVHLQFRVEIHLYLYIILLYYYIIILFIKLFIYSRY